MGRRLPWKRSEPELPVKAEVKAESPLSAGAKPLDPFPPPSRPRRVVEPSSDRIRSPSTSPPPEPPKEQFMIDGDDRYRMVEDEFLDVAQRFTTHLHRAEYNRLKSLAKSQNAAAIREIERPVVGLPTKVAKGRHEAVRRIAKQRSVLGENDESTPPWMGTGLQGLMESPKAEARTIRSFANVAPETRAAAGFGSRAGSPAQRAGNNMSARHRVSDVRADYDEADDDLAMSSSRGSTRLQMKSTPGSMANTFQTAQTEKPLPKSMSRAKSEPSLKRPSCSDEADMHEDDNDDLFGIKKRRVRRAQSREQIQKSSEKLSRKVSPDLIPTFL